MNAILVTDSNIDVVEC